MAGDIGFDDLGNGYDPTAFAEGEKFETEKGRFFNQNWAPVDESYTGQQYWYMYGARTTDRKIGNLLNERENFFHKPLVNLNHFYDVNDQVRISSIAYWSGGSGGGTGTYGSVSRAPAVEGSPWYASSPWTWDWNAEIEQNSANVDSAWSDTENRSTGILRNSINRQNTYGLISKMNYDVNDDLEVQVGIDWRTAGIEHAREVRDLLGGDYYVDFADDMAPDGKKVGLGDIIAYHNETTVDWFGAFLQGKYDIQKFNLYGMAGISTIGYSYLDHFGGEWSTFDGTGAPTYSKKDKVEADNITTFQVKGGGVFNLDDRLSAFANLGYVEKPPILDNVIDYDGNVATNPDNEKFQSFEVGGNYSSGMVAVKGSYYNTQWKDRNLTKSVETGAGDSGDTDIIYLTGVNQSHSGVEVEAKVALHEMVELDFAFSKGDWFFDGDAKGDYLEQEYNDDNQIIGQMTTEYTYALNNLKVGDMPQTAYVGGLTLKPIKGLNIQGLLKFYDDNYADWSPDAREVEEDGADRAQVWKAPGYNKLDLHLSYKLPEIAGFDLTVHGHVFNALDAIYVQDATDNSKYNGYGDKLHLAHNAEVFLGTPRYYNLGLTVNF